MAKYPPEGAAGVSVTRGDLEKLDPGVYLNDSIIDFYLKWWLGVRATDTTRARCHFFSSFFYTRLREAKGKERYNAVRRWTKNIDIFTKDYLFVPINKNLHWTLAVVCHPGKIGQCKRREGESLEMRKQRVREMKQGPRLLYFDSLRSLDATKHVPTRVQTLIRTYLNDEHNDKKGNPPVRFTAHTLPATVLQVPQQDNDFDCGVFLLQYAELFAQAPFRDLSKMNRKTWFKADWVIPEKRIEIRDIIEGLQVEAQFQKKQNKERLQPVSDADETKSSENSERGILGSLERASKRSGEDMDLDGSARPAVKHSGTKECQQVEESDDDETRLFSDVARKAKKTRAGRLKRIRSAE